MPLVTTRTNGPLDDEGATLLPLGRSRWMPLTIVCPAGPPPPPLFPPTRPPLPSLPARSDSNRWSSTGRPSSEPLLLPLLPPPRLDEETWSDPWSAYSYTSPIDVPSRIRLLLPSVPWARSHPTAVTCDPVVNPSCRGVVVDFVFLPLPSSEEPGGALWQPGLPSALGPNPASFTALAPSAIDEWR